MDHFINGSLVTGLGEGNGREITGVWAGITEARSELWIGRSCGVLLCVPDGLKAS